MNYAKLGKLVKAFEESNPELLEGAVFEIERFNALGQKDGVKFINDNGFSDIVAMCIAYIEAMAEEAGIRKIESEGNEADAIEWIAEVCAKGNKIAESTIICEQVFSKHRISQLGWVHPSESRFRASGIINSVLQVLPDCAAMVTVKDNPAY